PIVINCYRESGAFGIIEDLYRGQISKSLYYSQKLAIVAYKIKTNIGYCLETREKGLYLGMLGYITYEIKS
ncbi:unnamed protein product, partial [marine sediment metagenome]